MNKKETIIAGFLAGFVLTVWTGKAFAQMESANVPDAASWTRNFHLGGYGELHATVTEGSGGDHLDYHRFVLYLGYNFADWITFHSELELEHATTDKGGAYYMLEHGHVDFLLHDVFNIRIGRVLMPLGITNKKHEPPTFNGVERPLFDQYIIPTTWPSDGLGIFGSLTPTLEYEIYVVGGLDGSRFNATDGIKGGRIKARPSLNEPALTGRLDYYPAAQRAVPLESALRVGISFYFGGLDNGNQGVDPDITGTIQIYSGDIESSIGKFDARGAVAYEAIDGARDIGNGTASAIFGWYLEGAYHVWPESWKKGKFKRSDAVVFVRYDDVNTQYRMPIGTAPNPAGDREEWTSGLGFYPTPNLVIKADYQFRDSASSQDRPEVLNLGIGFQF